MFRSAMAAGVIFGAAFSVSASAQESQPRPAIQAIVDLFEKYQVVGLGDIHAADEVWRFYDSLVASPAFRAKVDDVTFECGNSRYQALMDRYIAGEKIPFEILQPIWRDNTFGGAMCESPVIRRFLEGIRNANLSSKTGRKLRVLLIDPPVDWATVKSRQDLGDRRDSMTSVLEREVYAKRRKALFLVGSTHIERAISSGEPAGARTLPPPPPPPPGGMEQKRGVDGRLLPLPGANGPVMRTFGGAGPQQMRLSPDGGMTPIERLERAHPRTTYSIMTYIGASEDTPRFEQWAARFPSPWLLDLKSSWVGKLRATSENMMRGPDGKPHRLPGHQFVSAWDGMLFVSPRAKLTRNSGNLPCDNPTFMKTLEARQAIRGTQPDSPFGVRAICATRAGKSVYFTD